MKRIYNEGRFSLIRMDRGEVWPDAFIGYCMTHDINAAIFTGIGGCEDPELAYYDLEHSREYQTKKFLGIYEIASLTGNLSLFEGERIVHAHAVLGAENYAAAAGHVVRFIVGGTLELSLTELDSTIERSRDEDTGLSLLS